MSNNDITKLTIAQLAELAKELGIKIPKGAKKGEIVKLIQTAQAPTQAPTEASVETPTVEKSNTKNKRKRNKRENNFTNEQEEGDKSDSKNGQNSEPNSGAGQHDKKQHNNNNNNRNNEGREPFIEVEGLLDIKEGHGFLRTRGYLPNEKDIFVAMHLVRRYGIRGGDYIKGVVKANQKQNLNQNQGSNQNFNQGPNQKQRFLPLYEVVEVNGADPAEAKKRTDFNKLTPLYPDERLRLETDNPKNLTERLIDIVAPIGKGQRGLIVAPPKAGKTIILQKIANAITMNNPDVHLIVVLVDERPEEVTDMERTVKGEVISSTFDRQPYDHTAVAELAIERAKRLVEQGKDVVVLLDSITRLSRAYNLAQPVTGRVLSGGVDAGALYPPKKFFGAARNIENGGSLTIIATALVETGSKMDEVIFEEFKGTGNLEIKLSRELSNKRIFPAIDINASGTRREELLMDPNELQHVFQLRHYLGGQEIEDASNLVLNKLKETRSNAEFLLGFKKTTSRSNNPY
jgi:transcription termination factor Rho